MPDNKPASGRKPVGEKRPRRPRSRGFARRRMEPTRRVVHAVESCPECGTGLAGGWVHLLRDILDLRELYPEDKALAQWAGAVQRIYASAKACADAGGLPRTLGQLVLEERLLSLCRPFLNDPIAPQARLCRRIERFINELFVFVSHPHEPPDNNAAERSLRHLVVSRKISGGTRSGRGSDDKMTLASLFGAWRAKGLNPLLECRKLLTSPQY